MQQRQSDIKEYGSVTDGDGRRVFQMDVNLSWAPPSQNTLNN